MSNRNEDEKTPFSVQVHDGPMESSAGSAEDDKHGDEERMKTYWWRWVVLTLFVANDGINNVIWITFGPAAT